MEGYSPHILDAAETIDEIWASNDVDSLARCWVKAAVPAPPQQGELRNLVTKYKNVFPKDAMESFLGYVGSISPGQKCSVSNVNDQRDVADIATLNESNINDWFMVEDSSEGREAMETEALEEVDRIMEEIDGSECGSSGRIEAEHTDTVMEENSNASQARPLSLIEAANEFSKIEAAAVALSLPGASSHLRRARRIIFEALKPQKKQKQTTLTGFLS